LPILLQIPIDERMSVKHTMAMRRTTVWLTQPQIKALEKLAKKTGLAQAELIRRFIDAGLKENK
jgi:hypothetical protein